MTFDVANRLADAHGAVGNTQTLVSACASVGYQNPDLTSHGSQIAEWFGSDDGLDLGVLDADCEHLRAALTIAEQAMRMEGAAGEGLNSAWSGDSGSAAADFVARHRRTVVALVELVRSAADGCASLRDALWRIVDTKVVAAIAIDDRRAGERTAWLAAARTVMGGGHDRSAAVEIIEKAVVPYVDSDIRIDWVDAMKAARNSAAKAYREVLNQLCRSVAIDFDLPGQLVPTWTGSRFSAGVPRVRELGPQQAGPQQTYPGSAERELSIQPSHAGTVAVPPSPPPVHPQATAPPGMEALPFASPTPGGLSSGLPEVPNLGGLTQSGSDPSTMPFGRIGEPVPINSGADDPNRLNADPTAESDDESAKRDHDVESEGDDQVDTDTDEQAEDDIETRDAGGPAEAGQSASEEGPVPQVNPPIAAQEQGPPPARETSAERIEETADVRTPCEIAADELPQVGQ